MTRIRVKTAKGRGVLAQLGKEGGCTRCCIWPDTENCPVWADRELVCSTSKGKFRQEWFTLGFVEWTPKEEPKESPT